MICVHAQIMLFNNPTKVYRTIECKTPFIKFLDESDPKMLANSTASFTTTPTGALLLTFISELSLIHI